MTMPEVTTALGRIRGRRTAEGVDAFKGIRYAEPPTGAYRWQPPRPVRPWAGIVDAAHFGPGCPQQPLPTQTQLPVMDEDCLHLNLWRPAGITSQDRLPVMVWIHGGGFVSGSASSSRYDGSAFARLGVILVSINYRVGRLGFFAHPALEKEPLRGNYGLMDQLEALRWVKQSIAAFGGNPDNITLFGESAGGMSIVSLLTSRVTTGLFHKAIIQSGSGRHNMVPGNDWATAVERTHALARRFDLPVDKSAASLAALQAIPADKLVEGLNLNNFLERPCYCAPMVDGVLIEDEPQTLLRQGAFHRIPMLIGTTDADLGFPMPVSTQEDALAVFRHDETLYARARAEFAHQPPTHIARQLATDMLMTEPARFIAQMAYRYHSPAWLYRFAYVPLALSDSLTGAPHESEIEFVFDTLASLHCPISAQDQAVASLMHHYWVTFAQHGQPSDLTHPSWTPYDPDQANVLWVSQQGIADTHMKAPDPWRTRLDLVATLAGDS